MAKLATGGRLQQGASETWMAQLFRPEANAIFRVAIVLTVLGSGGLLALVFLYARSDAVWNVGKPAPQPVPFRHDLHAGSLGLDCRYCHSTVERVANAGMPPAELCLGCHSQIWVGASVLEPLRTSLALDQPIRWTSVHRLPSYAYFHHGIHVSKGVACETCHGKVEQMAQTVKTHTLSMGWCLDCHRDSAAQARPGAWASLASEARRGAPADPVHGSAERLTDCNTCHR
jgi:hypothetical protein